MYFNRKNAEQKNWRMIKKGKHFLFGCSLVFAVGATLATPAVHADTAEAKAETTTLATQAEPTAETPTYVAPATTSPVATEVVEANSATTVVSADKSQLEAVLAQAKAKKLDGQEASVKAEVEAAITEAEALVANESASQEQVNQSVERLTQAVASVKEVTEATVETTTEAASEETTDSSETPKIRNKRATSEGTSRAVDESRLDRVTVTKDNFDSFFKEGGTANYDETSGTIKLTDDVSGQVGSAYLRFKIDPREDFTFTGKVDIGDKYEGHKVNGRDGGDGVGFVFHTGNVDTIGQSGASIGMGTIKNAFGFKLDSWHNTSNPNANQNASADPRYGGNAWRSNAFGSFYSSNNAGRVTTSSSAAKALNPKPNGEWVDFKIEYKGQSKEFIVTYGSEKWSTNLKTANASIMEPTAKTALNNSNATYALSFLGSTGSGTNLQRVQIEKFEFTAPQIVQVAFYDEAGNELAASSAIPGDRDQVVNLSNIEAVQKAISKIKAKGYTLKEVNSDKAETYNSGANTVTLRSGGQLLKYVFAVPSPAVTPTLQATGSMTVAGVKSTDNTLSGTGVPGATVTVKVAGATLADNITVGTDGTWTTTLSKGFNSNITNQDQLVPKDSVTITQKIGVSESQATEVAVGLGESTVQPSTDSKDQQSLVAETTTVTLKVPHDAGITYFDYPNASNGRSEVAIKRDSIPGAWTSKDESKAVVKSYSSDGFFDTVVLEMKDKIQAGKAKVISNIKETKYSSPTGWKEINVEAKPDTTPPTAPTVNAVKAGATSITGTAEANSTVEATLPNGSKATATAGADGSFTIPVSGLNEGDTISVTATDAATNKSDATTVTVKENVRPVVNIPYDDKANQIIYVYSGEENNIELKITDNSGKIAKAYLVFAQDNRTGLGTEDAGYLNGKTKSALYLKANRFGSETTATEANPAIIKLTANIPNGSYTDGTGMTRYIYAEDLAGNTNYDNVGAAGDTGAPGRIRFVWKPQTFKYTAVAPSTPITSNTVPEASAIEKAVKDANPTFSDKIESVSVDGTNVKVTYKDGSTDVIPADSVFKIAPTAPKVTPVKNPSSLEQPEKDAVKKAVETANPTATKVEVGQDGTTTLTYSNGSTAKLTPAQTVSQADVTPPAAPSVSPVTAGATAVTGTAEAGSTVEVTLPDGSKATAKADQDGNFSVPVSALKEGDRVSVTATDDAGNKSTPTSATVPDTTAPAAPVVNPVKAGDTAVTGTAEAGSTVEVTLPDGTKASATADQDGNFSVPVSGLEEGQTVSVTAKDASNNTSTPTTATVAKADDKTAPDAPVVNPVKAGDTAVTGTAEAGSTVEVTLPDGTKASATADQDGNFSVPVSGLEEGQTVSVTAKDASNNTSAPTTTTVAKADDKTAPAAPVVNPVKAGDTAVTGTAEAGSTVEVTLPDGTKASATADQDGNFSVPVSGLEEGQTVSVTAKDASNNTSTPTTATVAKADDKEAPAAPVVNPVKAGDTAVTGTAEAGSTVEVTLPDGTKASATADQDGNFSVPVSGLEEGQTVSVTAKDASNNTSTPTTATVAKADDKEAPAAPVVNPVKAGDTAVTGTAEAGSTVEVTLPDGTKASATADQDGNFSVPVSGLEEGQTVSVTAKDASNNTSTPTTATVAKADDKTAPDAPVVNPVKAGDTAVTGTAEAGSTVEVTLPDGTKASATADQDGNFSVPVSGLEEGQTVSVTAKDASNNTSTPTTATVAKADADSVKAPSTKTPVKDTANLTDAEKAKVKEAVEAANPGSKAEVGQDGTTKVTFPDGSTATLTGDQTVKTADSNGVQAPSTKTPVKDTANLTDAEKAKVKEAVEAANSGSKAEVGQDGTTKVTFPDGSTATLTGDQTVKTADSNGVQAPSTKTPVKDTANLTDAEKAKVKEAVEAANPGSKAEVGQDGTTTVTFPDGSTATLTGDQTVTKADITAPDAPVVNPVKAGDTAITGTAEAGSTVEVTLPDGTKVSAKADKDGKFSIPVSGLNAGDTVSVTATDESGNTSATTTVTVSNVNVGGKDADNAKVPVLTPVVDPNNLTDAEKAKVAEEVKKANPTATDVKVNNDGSVVVTFADGSVATIAANKVVKEATKESSAQAPAKKAGAKELPNTGTKQSNASLGLALLAAVTGGLLISKKRKEEE